MAAFTFSGLTNGQHVAFDPVLDVLNFSSLLQHAADVRLTESGGSLGFTWNGKTIWLDGMSLLLVALSNVTFADGSLLLIGDGETNPYGDWMGQHYTLGTSTESNQIMGMGGADVVETGSGNDWIVGNTALTPLVHLSRAGGVGSPTASNDPTISVDGNLVAFSGGWTGFGSTNNNATDVLVRNILTGVVINEHRDGSGVAGGSGSGSPVISADGLYLTFVSSSGLVAGSPPAQTIYLAETQTNVILAVSTTAGGAFANGFSYNPDLTGDGQTVVFESSATNLAAGGSAAQTDIFLKDMDSGAIQRISTSLTGGDANADCSGVSISADGEYVVFQSAATNLTAVETGGGYQDIYLWTAETGALINITGSLPGSNQMINPDVGALSGYGGVVVFETGGALVTGDTNNTTDIYSYNIESGAISRVSTQANGAQANSASVNAKISADGRFVVFQSYASNLVAGDTNGFADVFVKDLLTGAIALVSRTPVALGNQTSGSRLEISAGGDWIVFESSASNLAGTDGNGGFAVVFRFANPLLLDVLAGGAGNDTYVLMRNDHVIENAGGGTDTARAGFSYILAANVENLVMTGSGNIAGAGNALNNVITGNAGNNVMTGGAGIDTVSYGAATGPVIVSLAIAGAQATGAGSDQLVLSENLTGSAHDDRLTGNGFANVLNGGAGNDTLNGGLGADTYVVDSSADVITGETGGIDTVFTDETWTLQASLEHLTLTGTAANGSGNGLANQIIGNGAANILTGAAGNDTLNGAGGNDTLTGGAGNDRLTGGAGPDAFVFNTLIGSDLNTDFVSGSDKLRFQMSAFDIGDNDMLLEGSMVRSAAGGFSAAAELVIFTANVGSLSTANAAAAIGSATSAYAVGHQVLFAVDTGASSGVYLFRSADGNAAVSAAELTLLTTLQGSAATALADYLLIA